MKKTRLIQTCVFAVAAVGLCVLGSVAQEQAGYATLSGRPNQPTYAQRQVAAQKASYNAAQAYARAEAQIAQTAYQGIGCTTAPPLSAPAPAATGCGSCGQTAATGCGCNSAVPFPSGNCAQGSCATGCGESAPCNTAVPFPAGGCATGSCATGGCATGSCGTDACGSASVGRATMRRTPVRNWMQSNQRMRQTNRMGRRMQASCDPYGGSSYGAGYNNRMNRLLGSRRGNQACGTGAGGACGLRGGLGGLGGGGLSGLGGGGGSACSSFWARSSQSYQSRNARLSQHLFGWLVPSGNGGQGSPPIGKYHTTYTQNANHFDQRDGEVYAAQGYGTNVTVPLAPNVRHAYNYGWGMPSSRITRVSSVAPYTTLRPLHW